MDLIDYSINYRKSYEEYFNYLKECEKYKEHCKKYGKSDDVTEPVRPQKIEFPYNSWQAEQTAKKEITQTTISQDLFRRCFLAANEYQHRR